MKEGDRGLGRSGWLWVSWVAANALGELVGLGLTGAIGALILSRQSTLGDSRALFELLLAVVSGACVEGVAVGLAQWTVLRRVLTGIARRTWILATAVGAAVAWALGMLPSTMMDTGGEASAPGPEPSAATILVMTIGLGIVGGAILAGPQWLILRRHLAGAGWWVLFNAAAWAAGMPIAFAAVSAVIDGRGIAIAAGLLLATGAVVGAIHGLGLVWLVRERAV